jgi:hypothetical protein
MHVVVSVRQGNLAELSKLEPSAKDIADIPGCREKGSIMRELT